jgi:hypothetical protein
VVSKVSRCECVYIDSSGHGQRSAAPRRASGRVSESIDWEREPIQNLTDDAPRVGEGPVHHKKGHMGHLILEEVNF